MNTPTRTQTIRDAVDITREHLKKQQMFDAAVASYIRKVYSLPQIREMSKEFETCMAFSGDKTPIYANLSKKYDLESDTVLLYLHIASQIVQGKFGGLEGASLNQ